MPSIVDNRRKFHQNFTHNWPSMLQYVRSTRHPKDVIPELREPVKKILYDYAQQTGHLPNLESMYKVYLHLLSKQRDKELENFFWTKKAKARREARRQRRAERIASGERVGLGRFISKIGKGVANLKLLPLAPFMAMMKEALKRQGVATPRGEGIKVVVSKFLRFVVKKLDPKSYPEQAVMELDGLKDDEENLAIGPIITTIISAVSNFIKHLKNKKREGVTLSDSEEKILVNSEIAAKEYERLKREEIESEVGSFVSKNLVFILAGILALFFFLRK